MTPATSFETKCATIGCPNERKIGGRLCLMCDAALKALPPDQQFATKAKLPGLFDEAPPTAPAPLGTTRRPRARKSDPATSHRAAHGTARELTTKQRAVVLIFRLYGPNLHDEALVKFYRDLRTQQLALGAGPLVPDLTDSSIRTRRAELVKLTRVRDTGHTTTTARGNESTVWALVEHPPASDPPATDTVAATPATPTTTEQ